MSGLFKQVLSLQAFVGVDNEAEPMASGLAGFDERLVSQPNLLEERGDDLIAFRILFREGFSQGRSAGSVRTTLLANQHAYPAGNEHRWCQWV